MSNWTEKQEQAITAKDCSVIVSASAGSGKTSVLVERLLRQLISKENKIPADRIVVVTFTNDAAAEMKQRLAKALSDKLKETPDDNWLNRQYMLLQSAHISTIHSFCFDLIRENIDKFQISAGFRIVDETEYKVLLSNQIDETFEYYYQNKNDDIKYISNFFGGNTDKNLREIILALYKYIESIPFNENWLDKVVKSYSDNNSERISQLFSLYKKYLTDKISSIISDIEICLKIAEDISADKAYDIFINEMNAFTDVNDCIKTMNSIEDCDNLLSAVKNVVYKKMTFPTYETEYEIQYVEMLKDMRTKYKADFKALINNEIFTAEQIHEDISEHYKVTSILIGMIKLFINNVKLQKIDKNAITFSDAEQLALKLLATMDENEIITKTPLAKSLSDYYKIIMLDEYQDSNDIQDLIFKMLSHNGTAEHNGQNMFVVGDIKQSIYKFRHANPEIFLNTLNDAKPYINGTDRKNSSITLNKNFRSSSGVIDFVNFVFKNIMSEKVGNIDYNDNEALVQGTMENKDTDSATEVAFICKDEVSENSDSDITAEAEYVAHKINSMIEEGMLVNNGGNTRKCCGGDFCILVRKNSSVLPFIKKLSEYGIQTYSEDISGYLQSREISILLNMLRIISNPLQDIPLSAILMSPIYGMTTEEFSKMRLNTPKGYVYNSIQNILNGSEVDEASKEKPYYIKCKKFNEDFQKLRVYASGVSLQQLVLYIYNDTDFMTVIQLYRDGEQKRANLRLLLEYIKSYESSSNGGLSGFIGYIDKISENGGDFKQANTTAGADNAVKIKTMHKSKGLEFPFVFICKTSSRFNTMDLNSQIQYNSKYGISFKIQNKKTLSKYSTMPYIAIRSKNKNDMISEELRLLYVALTRAKQKLFITLEYDSLEHRNSYLKHMMYVSQLIAGNNYKISSQIASKVTCMQDWLAMAILLCKDCDKVLNEIGIDPVASTSDEIHINAIQYILNNNQFDKEEIKKSSNSDYIYDNEFVKKISDYCSFVYDEQLTQLPAKVTVSEISHKSSEISLKMPSFATGKISGTEKGTAIHTFMQFADYPMAEKNLKDEAERLYKNGKLTKKQLDILDYSALKKFFISDLYLNLIKGNIIHREKQFLIKFNDIINNVIKYNDKDVSDLVLNYLNTESMLQGVADCIIEYKDYIIVIDYKTDKINTDEKFKDNYNNQIKLYSAAFEKIFNKPVKSNILYSFHMNKAIICD